MRNEAYPGQAYFHEHNANIKRAEEAAMRNEDASDLRKRGPRSAYEAQTGRPLTPERRGASGKNERQLLQDDTFCVVEDGVPKFYPRTVNQAAPQPSPETNVRYCGHEAPIGKPCPVCYPPVAPMTNRETKLREALQGLVKLMRTSTHPLAEVRGQLGCAAGLLEAALDAATGEKATRAKVSGTTSPAKDGDAK